MRAQRGIKKEMMKCLADFLLPEMPCSVLSNMEFKELFCLNDFNSKDMVVAFTAFILLYDKNQHCTVKQFSTNLKKKKKKNQMLACRKQIMARIPI